MYGYVFVYKQNLHGHNFEWKKIKVFTQLYLFMEYISDFSDISVFLFSKYPKIQTS